MTTKTEIQKGLSEDELTKALSKLSSTGVKVIQNQLKQLIDLTKPEDSTKDVYDLIEDKVLELINLTTKGDDFKKKKKEIQTEFCKVTGKKLPEDDKEEEKKSSEEKKEDEKPVEAAEESKAESKSPEDVSDDAEEAKLPTPATTDTIMIDTTDSEAKPSDQQVETAPLIESISNEANSDIQRSLKMTDELNNHCTLVMEANDYDKDDNRDEEEDIEQNFVDATKCPDRKVALNQVYREELENLQNLQCRSTFFNLLAFGYKTYESVAEDIQMNTDKFNELQALIFNELSESQL